MAFDKVSKEFGFSTANFGVKPEPSKTKKTVGTLNISAKTDEKKVHPLFKKEDPEKQKQQPTGTITQQQLEQQQQAVTYSANAVGEIFATMFNIFHNRYPMCSKLSEAEKMQLGESWLPILKNTF